MSSLQHKYSAVPVLSTGEPAKKHRFKYDQRHYESEDAVLATIGKTITMVPTGCDNYRVKVELSWISAAGREAREKFEYDRRQDQ